MDIHFLCGKNLHSKRPELAIQIFFLGFYFDMLAAINSIQNFRISDFT